MQVLQDVRAKSLWGANIKVKKNPHYLSAVDARASAVWCEVSRAVLLSHFLCMSCKRAERTTAINVCFFDRSDVNLACSVSIVSNGQPCYKKGCWVFKIWFVLGSNLIHVEFLTM